MTADPRFISNGTSVTSAPGNAQTALDRSSRLRIVGSIAPTVAHSPFGESIERNFQLPKTTRIGFLYYPAASLPTSQPNGPAIARICAKEADISAIMHSLKVVFSTSICRTILGIFGLAAISLPTCFAALNPCTDSSGTTALQTAITNAENAGGGTVTMASTGGLPGGECDLGTGLVFHSNKGHVQLVGAGIGATVMSYAGTSGDAIKIGDSSAQTNFITLANLSVDLSAGASCSGGITSVGIHTYEAWWVTLNSVEVKTSFGCSTSTGQKGVFLDGSSTWSAYTMLNAVTIRGDFTDGVLVGSSGSGEANATTIVGGSIAGTTATQDGEGIRIEHGDTTKVLNTDVTGWNYGVHVLWSGNGPINARFEANKGDPSSCTGTGGDWTVDSTVFGVSFLGAGYSCYVNNGASITYPGCASSSGTGSPNSAVVGSPCDIYVNKSGGAGTTLWVKESGSATNTGWVAK